MVKNSKKSEVFQYFNQDNFLITIDRLSEKFNISKSYAYKITKELKDKNIVVELNDTKNKYYRGTKFI